jgi:hypothetical protein
MKNTHFYYIFILLFLSCKKDHNTQDTIQLKISSENYHKEIKLSSIIEEAHYIRLETNDECLLGSLIKKIIVTDNKIYILELNTNSIFVFDINGNYIFKINRVGKGPGEYISPGDFQVNEKTGTISVLDVVNKKINYYDAAGNFISDLTFKYRCLSYAFQDDFIYLDRANARYTSNDQDFDHNVYILLKDGKLINKFLPTKKYLENFVFIASSPFLPYKKTINYQGVFDNNIYSFYQDSMSIKYNIDFGKKWPDKKVFTKLLKIKTNNPQVYYNKLKDEGYILHMNFFESDNFMHIYFYEHDIIYNVFFSKNTWKSKGFNLNSYIDDISGIGYDRVYNITNDGKFVSAINASNALKNLDKIDNQDLYPNLEEIDNPIIMLFTLKPF